jgi:hypothetical protein
VQLHQRPVTSTRYHDLACFLYQARSLLSRVLERLNVRARIYGIASPQWLTTTSYDHDFELELAIPSRLLVCANRIAIQGGAELQSRFELAVRESLGSKCADMGGLFFESGLDNIQLDIVGL